MIPEKLFQWQNANLFRQRHVMQTPQSVNVICDQKPCISFCSNDYLGLANYSVLIDAFKKGCDRYGVGSGASQLICGHSQAHHDLEQAFADFLHCERALYFSNGFMANLGVISALTNQEDHIFQDKKNHASLLDAGRLSQAQSRRYLHKNISSLENHLNKIKKGRAFIISDSVFSTNGAIAPLSELISTKNKYQSTLIIDDAHAIGVLGKNGGGSIEYFNLSSSDISVIVCPLGKAFGCYGAIVAADSNTIEMLIQFARSYIYTTALPPAIAVVAQKSLEIVQKESWRREKLNELIIYFRQYAHQTGLTFQDSITPIQSLEIASPIKGMLLKEKLFQRGYLVYLLRPPTVEKNKSVLRITLSAIHEKKQIKQLLDDLSDEYRTIS